MGVRFTRGRVIVALVGVLLGAGIGAAVVTRVAKKEKKGRNEEERKKKGRN